MSRRRQLVVFAIVLAVLAIVAGVAISSTPGVASHIDKAQERIDVL